jgi:hypothetical protein
VNRKRSDPAIHRADSLTGCYKPQVIHSNAPRTAR